MQKINPNDPAFPIPITWHANERAIIDATEYTKANGGMSIRTQLAAMAMQGYISNWGRANESDFQYIAELSVRHADALIEELNKNMNAKKNK